MLCCLLQGALPPRHTMANVSPKRFSEEAEAAVSVLRAIVTSKKGASTVHSVLADFRELEGGPLMYKKFGFPNADEFLKATGAFVVQSRMGEVSRHDCLGAI